MRGYPRTVQEHLQKARDSALLAVEVYNKPAVSFKSSAYITLMVIAWTALFHAVFFKRKIKPFYRKQSGQFVRMDGEPIVQAYDFARATRDAGVTVIGGFQSPIEKDCLDLLLRGSQPVIICPARSLHGIRLPTVWKKAIEQQRLLLLSPFAERIRRPNAEISEQRNEFVASIADQVLFAYANPGGKTEALARKVIGWSKPVFTFGSKENTNLVALGASVLGLEEIVWLTSGISGSNA